MEKLGYRVLIAVLLGFGVGIFFGPLTASLKPIGDVYTMLLQMAVLPYVFLSLIHGLGSLTYAIGKRLFFAGWPYLLVLWTLAIGTIFLLVQLIPTTYSYLINIPSPGEPQDSFASHFLSFLIPQNPFYDFSQGIVPAIVLLGLIFGLALMQVPNKTGLIDALEQVNKALEKILYWIGVISPIGAFTYIAIGAGTIHFEDFHRLQLFILGFIVTTLFITFWILPTLLSCLTPLKFREALSAIRYVCLLPFVTGLPTMTLPFLNLYLNRLAGEHSEHDRFRETSQTVLPVAYSFGNIGNAMVLFFIIFLGYYYRHPLSGLDKALLSILTIPLSIGSSAGTVNSVVFLTKQLGLPAGAADFFLQLKSVTYNFQVMMSSAGVLTLILLTLYAYYGLLQVRWKSCLFRLSLSVALFGSLIFLLRPMAYLGDLYEQRHMKFEIAEVLSDPVDVKIVEDAPSHASNTSTMEQVLSSRILRVGFNKESIPFCYNNDKHQLVGFDIAYAYQLADDLGCDLQLIPFDFDSLGKDLSDGRFDLGMSSIIMTEERLSQMDFSVPYWEDRNVLVVPRKKRHKYTKLEEVQKRAPLRIGAGGAQVAMAKRYFPNATIIDTVNNGKLQNGELDLIFWSETSAVIWCVSHPEFVSIAYGNRLGKNYFAYPFRQNSLDFGFFFNNWLALKKQSGFESAMRSYWIEGRPPISRTPRWSILRNVLHYGD